MADPVETIQFLAGSWHRVAALQTLDAAPWTRHDLQNELGVSQPTVSRIIRAFDDRDWIRRDGPWYATTPLGSLVAEAFTDLETAMTLEARLRSVSEWLPETGFPFDLEVLGDAEITRASATDPTAIWTMEAAYLREADRVHILTDRTPHQSVEATWEQVTQGSQQFTLVVPTHTYQSITEDERLTRFHREMLDLGNAAIYRYDGSVSTPLIVTDEWVHIGLMADDDRAGAIVTTDDETVRDWALGVIDDRRAESEAVTTADFPA